MTDLVVLNTDQPVAVVEEKSTGDKVTEGLKNISETVKKTVNLPIMYEKIVPELLDVIVAMAQFLSSEFNDPKNQDAVREYVISRYTDPLNVSRNNINQMNRINALFEFVAEQIKNKQTDGIPPEVIQHMLQHDAPIYFTSDDMLRNKQ